MGIQPSMRQLLSYSFCIQGRLALAFTFACVFALIFGMLSNVAFILAEFGVSTIGSGVRMASMPPCISIGVAVTYYLFEAPKRSMLGVLGRAMCCQLMLV